MACCIYMASIIQRGSRGLVCPETPGGGVKDLRASEFAVAAIGRLLLDSTQTAENFELNPRFAR